MIFDSNKIFFRTVNKSVHGTEQYNYPSMCVGSVLSSDFVFNIHIYMIKILMVNRPSGKSLGCDFKETILRICMIY